MTKKKTKVLKTELVKVGQAVIKMKHETCANDHVHVIPDVMTLRDVIAAMVNVPVDQLELPAQWAAKADMPMAITMADDVGYVNNETGKTGYEVNGTYDVCGVQHVGKKASLLIDANQ